MTEELRRLKQTLKSQPKDERVDHICSPSTSAPLSKDTVLQNGQSSLPTDELVSEAAFGLPDEDASPPTLIEAELGNSRFSREEIRDLFRL